MSILVDTNIIIDILTEDPVWADWSEQTLSTHERSGLFINSAIYSELCYGCSSFDQVDSIIDYFGLTYLEITKRGLFSAAKAYKQYKAAGGKKTFRVARFLHRRARRCRKHEHHDTRHRSLFQLLPQLKTYPPCSTEITLRNTLPDASEAWYLMPLGLALSPDDHLLRSNPPDGTLTRSGTRSRPPFPIQPRARAWSL